MENTRRVWLRSCKATRGFPLRTLSYDARRIRSFKGKKITGKKIMSDRLGQFSYPPFSCLFAFLRGRLVQLRKSRYNPAAFKMLCRRSFRLVRMGLWPETRIGDSGPKAHSFA